jgi:hypothetical protein
MNYHRIRFGIGARLIAVLPAIFLLVAVQGCDPTRFMMEGKNPIQCRNYSLLHQVEKTGPNILVHDSGEVCLTVMDLTQFRFSTFVRLLKGDGFVLMMRPRAEEVVLDSGLSLFLSRSHSKLDSSGTMVQDLRQYQVAQDSLTLLTVRSENNLLQVTLGCDTVLKRMTGLKESDDLVFGALQGSEVRLVNPSFQELKEQ